MTYSILGITICTSGVILLNILLIYRINKATDVSKVKLSAFWKMILFTFTLGAITEFVDFVKTYNSIQPGADVNEVTHSIQLHILHGLSYLGIIVMTIINWFVIKHFRQLKYNKTFNEKDDDFSAL